MPFNGAVFHHAVFHVQLDPALVNHLLAGQQQVQVQPAVSNSNASSQTNVLPANVPVGNVVMAAPAITASAASSGATSQTNVMPANIPAHMVMAVPSVTSGSSSGTFVPPQVTRPRHLPMGPCKPPAITYKADEDHDNDDYAVVPVHRGAAA